MYIVDFQPSWKSDFDNISQYLSLSLNGTYTKIIHVGSTSIPGVIAKPIIDIDVVLDEIEQMKDAQTRLESIGYAHRGDLGISGRESFAQPAHLPYHHLYLVHKDTQAYLDHIDFKSALIENPLLVEKYNSLKRSLEHLLLKDRNAYTEGKSQFINEVLVEFRSNKPNPINS